MAAVRSLPVRSGRWGRSRRTLAPCPSPAAAWEASRRSAVGGWRLGRGGAGRWLIGITGVSRQEQAFWRPWRLSHGDLNDREERRELTEMVVGVMGNYGRGRKWRFVCPRLKSLVPFSPLTMGYRGRGRVEDDKTIFSAISGKKKFISSYPFCRSNGRT